MSDLVEELTAGDALVWVDEAGIIHVGDDELAWDLTPAQARVWAKRLAVAAQTAEEGQR
jgi:hypothetical protein